MSNILKVSEEKLGTYLALANGTLNIPYTQRPYEWSKSQITRLFNDILSVYKRDQVQHILNFITIYEEDENLYIYDGQQRTVSLMIIICAFVNKLKSLGENKVADQITSEYICEESWKTGNIAYKINFSSEQTNNFFRKYVINGNIINSNEDLTDYEKKIKDNYDIVNKLIEEHNIDITRDEIKNIIACLTDQMLVIVLKTPSEDVANQMFETLNNTGKKLADFYVLKNNCVKVIGEELTSEYWNEIESNTDGLSKSKFLTQFVSIYNGKTSSKNVYEALEKRKNINSKEGVKELLKEMSCASKIFLQLNEPRQKNKGDKKELDIFEGVVKSLKLFKAEQYKPVIMAMELRQYELQDINIIMSEFLKLHIRNIFICKNKANTLEKFYPELAAKIYSSEDELDVSDIIKEIRDKKLNNNEVIQILEHRAFMDSSENQQTRYILRQIYNSINGEETKISQNSDEVNLEHILPKNPQKNSEWYKIFSKDEDRNKYTYLLGNLTLIQGKKNSEASNKDFKEKKEIYRNSSIIQNKEIAEKNVWQMKEIIDRTIELSKKIIEIW